MKVCFIHLFSYCDARTPERREKGVFFVELPCSHDGVLEIKQLPQRQRRLFEEKEISISRRCHLDNYIFIVSRER